jgi:hypothetical protein
MDGEIRENKSVPISLAELDRVAHFFEMQARRKALIDGRR